MKKSGNHGTTVEKSGGSKIMTAYGLDKSDYVGPASAERGGSMGGGINNLSHSISGTSANQKGS